MTGVIGAPAGHADAVAVGRIGPVRGLRGEVYVQPLTDDPAARFAPGVSLLTEPADAGPLQVHSSDYTGGRLVVRFDGVDDRAQAAALRGTTLLILPAQRPALEDPDEFYDTDLLGLRAQTPRGDPIGEVSEVRHIGGNDQLVVRGAGREHLVPFVAAIVTRVDLASGVVVVDAPEGLFDL